MPLSFCSSSMTSPECSVVWPMMVESKVVLPTPLRPITLMHSPGASLRSMSSSPTGPPEPAETCRNSSALATTGLPQIDRAHLRVRLDIARRARSEHRAAHHHRDLLGEAEHHVHVVLDDQHGYV